MIEAAVGGVLIGLAAVWLYASLGRIAGISGILGQVLAAPGNLNWPVWFLLGLGGGGWIGLALGVGAERVVPQAEHILWLLAGGLLVGFGTRLGSGCTSGHGVCGVARIAPRSLSATLTFLAVGMLTATVLHA